MQYLIFGLLCLFYYGPLGAFMYTGLLMKAFRLFFRIKLRKNVRGGKLGVINPTYPKLVDVMRVSDEKRLCFILERGHLYSKLSC